MKRATFFTFLVGALAFMVVALSHGFGMDLWAPDQLTIAVDWLEGFTRHVDGVAAVLANGGAVVAGVKNKTGGDANGDDDPAGGGTPTPPPGVNTEDLINTAMDRVFNSPQFQDVIGQATKNAASGQNPPANAGNDPAGDGLPAPRRIELPRLLIDVQERTAGRFPGVRVVEERSREDKTRCQLLTAELIRSLALRNMSRFQDVQRNLIHEGFYATHFERGYATLTDEDGGVFLPTLIVDDIAHQRPTYGIADQFALRVPLDNLGTYRLPKMTGEILFVATAENQAVTFSKTSLGAINLSPKKWSGGTTWTREINMLAAATLLPVLNVKIADGLAKAKDNALFNGDGSSTYNGVIGIFDASRTGVGSVTLGTGKDSFADATWEDYRLAPTKIDTSAMNNARWVFHPHSPPQYLDGLKDGNDNPIYRGPADVSRPNTFYGRPVNVTEVVNGPAADAASTIWAAYGDFSQVMLGDYMGISVRMLDQASITDEDGNTVNLGTQQGLAMIFNAYFDMQVTFENAFMYFKTAA